MLTVPGRIIVRSRCTPSYGVHTEQCCERELSTAGKLREKFIN